MIPPDPVADGRPDPLFEAIERFVNDHDVWPEHAEVLRTARLPRQEAGSSPIGVSLAGLETTGSTSALVDAVTADFAWLSWRQNPTYVDREFLRRYAYCELIGPTGHVRHANCSVGLLHLAPDTYYPPHSHPAEEIYLLLAGPSSWQVGDAAMADRTPGARIFHASHQVHRMRSGPTPLLALYLWRGDLATPAALT